MKQHVFVDTRPLAQQVADLEFGNACLLRRQKAQQDAEFRAEDKRIQERMEWLKVNNPDVYALLNTVVA